MDVFFRRVGLLRGVSAIDGQDDAGDERGAIGQQEGCGVGDFLGPSQATDRVCPSSKHLAQVWRGVNGERASSGVGF